MLKTVSECFTSTRVHIGMDEAVRVGLGKYLKNHKFGDRFDIINRHLHRVCEIAEKPFICSHSDSRAVNGAFARNITDGQFKEIIRRGGAAGINFCTDFLGGDKGTGAVLSHIEHFLSLGGEKNIGLGSDFDGIPCLPHGCRGVEYAADIAEELLKRNYKEEIVYDILYGNFLRIFKQIFK